MREIKFRAVIDENQVVQVLSLNSDGSVIVKFGLESGFIPSHRVKAILQFTGLKDKNDVDIYEGDIFAINDIDERFYYKIYIVSYFSEDAAFVFACDDGKCSMSSIIDYSGPDGDYEVIGNIYENPELLNEE